MLDHDVAEIKHFGQIALVISQNVCQVALFRVCKLWEKRKKLGDRRIWHIEQYHPMFNIIY